MVQRNVIAEKESASGIHWARPGQTVQYEDPEVDIGACCCGRLRVAYIRRGTKGTLTRFGRYCLGCDVVILDADLF